MKTLRLAYHLKHSLFAADGKINKFCGRTERENNVKVVDITYRRHFISMKMENTYKALATVSSRRPLFALARLSFYSSLDEKRLIFN